MKQQRGAPEGRSFSDQDLEPRVLLRLAAASSAAVLFHELSAYLRDDWHLGELHFALIDAAVSDSADEPPQCVHGLPALAATLQPYPPANDASDGLETSIAEAPAASDVPHHSPAEIEAALCVSLRDDLQVQVFSAEPLQPAAQAVVKDCLEAVAPVIVRVAMQRREELAHREEAGLICLYRELARASELPDVLELLGQEIRRRALFDGYWVMLREGDELICRHMDLPLGYKGMEPAYAELRIPLSDHTAEAQVIASGQPVYLGRGDISAYSQTLQQRFERWCMESLVLIPFYSFQGSSGLLAGFRQSGTVCPSRLKRLVRRLRLFADHLHHANTVTELKRRQSEVVAAEQLRQRFLGLIGQLVELTDTDQIYKVITREFLSWLPFEVAGVLRADDGRLKVKRLAYKDSAAEVGRKWQRYYGEVSYEIDEADGVSARCFLSNQRIFFPDGLRIMGLPMSAKDRRALELLKTPRTILFVPIRQNDVPVGVLWLGSVTQPVEITEAQMVLAEAVCSIVGTTIANAELYTTVERQKAEIQQALQTLEATQARLAKAEQERMQALVQAKEAAEASSAAKSFFVANTSHEIRTPLTAIIGFAENLEEQATDPEVRESAEVILRNGRHLLGLIGDILDFTKIESGRVEVESAVFRPRDIIYELESTIEVLAREKGLAFRIDRRFPLPEHISGDPNRLRQVLLNLCNNAVKFTDEGEVTVTVECDIERELLIVGVADTGVGIPQDQLQRVFEPFVQLEAPNGRHYGGTGLGMAIARDLVELMGGRLEVDSKVGRGSVFRLELPTGSLADTEWVLDIGECARRETSTQAAPAVPRLRGSVLLVEDGPDNQRLLKLLVERCGASVSVAGDGAEAIELALEREFDLVLMDIQMPLVTGTEALAHLRQLGYRKPIVALTANVLSEDVEQYLGAGFDGYLSKPVDRRAFYRTLEAYLAPDKAAGAEQGQALSLALQELREDFDASLSGHLQRMQHAWEAEDWPSVAYEAHKIKGGAATFGRQEVGALATTLEWLARRVAERKRAPEELQRLLERFEEMLAG